MSNFNTENRIREILDFAMNEPESTADLKAMIKESSPEVRSRLSKIAGNLVQVQAPALMIIPGDSDWFPPRY